MTYVTTFFQRIRNYFLCIFVLLTFLQFSSTKAQSYSVILATSTPGANGIYLPDGNYGGITKYNNGTHTLFHAVDQNMIWAILDNSTALNINDVANSPYKYSSKLEGDTPPSRGWHHGGNTTGLPGESIIVVPLNSIGYSKHFFIESIEDNGTLPDTLLVFLYADGVTFTGSNGEDFIAQGKASITNIPSGLSAELIRTSDTTLIVYLDGTADEHTFKDNIDALTLTFENTAVSNNDISAIEYSTFDFGIRFQNPYIIEGILSPPAANGMYRLYGMFNEKPYYRNGMYYLMSKGCQPKWIIRAGNDVHPKFSTQLETELPGNRQWHNGGFYYTIKDDLNISMTNSIVYTSYSFVESDANDGAFIDSIEIRYYFPEAGSSFSGNNNDDFVADGKVEVSNLPDGLSAEIIKYNDTTLFAKLTGNEVNHEMTDNINNLVFEFKAEAFDGPGIFSTCEFATDSVNVVHMQKYVVVDTTNFTKPSNGIYDPYEIINNRAAYKLEDDHFLIYRDAPPNCVWSLLRKSSQNAVYSNSLDQNDPPSDNWVFGDYNGTAAAPVEVFPYQPWISYSNLELRESEEENGVIIDSVYIAINSIENIIFTGDIGENYISTGKAEVMNLSAGLESSIIKENDNLLILIVSGSADQNSSSDNVDNVEIHIADAALSAQSENVKYKQIYGIQIVFNNISGLTENTTIRNEKFFFPNPANDFITINQSLTQGKNTSFTCYNLVGNSVLEGKLTGNRINISAMPAGLYILMIDIDGKKLIDKLIIE